MKKFFVSENTAETIRNYFTVSPAPNNHGYSAAIRLQAPPQLGGHVYTLYSLKGPRPFYVLEATEAPQAGSRRAFLTFRDYTPGEITLDSCETFKGGSNYGRREKSERLLNKYKQLACIVYGAIAAGLLEEATQEPETEPEAATAAAILDDLTHQKLGRKPTEDEKTLNIDFIINLIRQRGPAGAYRAITGKPAPDKYHAAQPLTA